ncbi:MAG: hypothetical protein V4717_22270 [Bacteroidota bacterium]
MEFTDQQIDYGTSLACTDFQTGIYTFNKDYSTWKRAFYDRTGLEFGTRKGDVTGRVLFNTEHELSKRRYDTIEYNGWQLTRVKTIMKGNNVSTISLKISGNPAKNVYGKNETNISMQDLHIELKKLSFGLGINLADIKTRAPHESSITVEPNFPVDLNTLKGRIITLIGYNPFTPMVGDDGEGNLIGYKSKCTHYYAKIYSPASKFGDPTLNSVRIERHYERLNQSFKNNCTMHSFADYLIPETQYKCGVSVLKMLDNTFIYDPELKANRWNKGYINEIIHKGNDPKYWNEDFPNSCCKKTQVKRIEEYNELSAVKGDGLFLNLRDLVINHYNKLQNVTCS